MFRLDYVDHPNRHNFATNTCHKLSFLPLRNRRRPATKHFRSVIVKTKLLPNLANCFMSRAKSDKWNRINGRIFRNRSENWFRHFRNAVGNNSNSEDYLSGRQSERPLWLRLLCKSFLRHDQESKSFRSRHKSIRGGRGSLAARKKEQKRKSKRAKMSQQKWLLTLCEIKWNKILASKTHSEK